MIVALIIGLIVLGWLACGVLAHGRFFAYFQREFPSLAEESYWDDFRQACFVGLTGPFGLLGGFIATGTKHGLKWW